MSLQPAFYFSGAKATNHRFSCKHITPLPLPITTISILSTLIPGQQATSHISCILIFISACQPLSSHFVFSFPLTIGPHSPTQEVSWPALPLSLLLISLSFFFFFLVSFAHMQNCVQYFTRREKLWFIPTVLLLSEKLLTLSGSPSSVRLHPHTDDPFITQPEADLLATLQPHHEHAETEWVLCVFLWIHVEQLHSVHVSTHSVRS